MRFIFFLGISFPFFVAGQVTLDDTVVHDKVLVCPQYSTAWTGGDLVHRFGFLNLVGFGAGYKFKNNVFALADANFIFGNKVKIPGIFEHLVDSYGNITDVNGDVATVSVLARGVSVNAQIGKIFPLNQRDKNSGIMVHAGLGYLNHRVKIETQTQVVPMIELEYKKGYDRLTTGVNSMQFIGYAYMPKQSFYSFYGGIYAMQGFTKNRRTLFYDQPDVPVSTALRLDLIMGIKVGWFIPFYSTQKDYYIEY
ncbi:MAG: hypothetical protein ACKO4K_08075 [Flavobacteriales bacterium]